MTTEDPGRAFPDPKAGLYRRIWLLTGRRQMMLIGLAVVIALLTAAPLEFQKAIINGLGAAMPVPELVQLAIWYAAVVLLVAGLKFALGYGTARTGETAVLAIRKRVLAHQATPDATAIPQGTLVNMLSGEAEVVGSFAGSAFAMPVVQIGTLASVLAFIAASQPLLGLVALAVVAPQAFIVLDVQRRVTALVRERVSHIQRAADRVAALVDDAPGMTAQEHFDAVYDLQRQVHLLKQGSKFAINTLNALGVVATLALGGYLVIRGQSDVGTVVAALSGLSRIAKPWNELIAFYRQWSVVKVRFALMANRLA
jgi:ABC-type bacteriocin/lantibiotic exporter with double-glycine peptidase domain